MHVCSFQFIYWDLFFLASNKLSTQFPLKMSHKVEFLVIASAAQIVADFAKFKTRKAALIHWSCLKSQFWIHQHNIRWALSWKILKPELKSYLCKHKPVYEKINQEARSHRTPVWPPKNTNSCLPRCTCVFVQALRGYIRQEGWIDNPITLEPINAKRAPQWKSPGPTCCVDNLAKKRKYAQALGCTQQIKGEAFRQWAAGDLSFSASPNAPKSLSPCFCNWASVVNVVLTALHAPVHPFPTNAICITLYIYHIA